MAHTESKKCGFFLTVLAYIVFAIVSFLKACKFLSEDDDKDETRASKKSGKAEEGEPDWSWEQDG